MKKIAVLFPNQSAQYKGMGKFLYDNYEEAKEVIRVADDVLMSKNPNFRISEYIFYDYGKDNIMLEFNCPSVLVISVALYSVFYKTYNVLPEVFAGYGIGELSALTCANIIRLEDALILAFNIGKIFKSYGYSTIEEEIKSIHKKKIINEVEKEVRALSVNNKQNFSNVVNSVDGTDYEEKSLVHKLVNSIFNQKDWEKVIEAIGERDVHDIIDIGPSRWIGMMSERQLKKERMCYLDYPGDGYYSLAIFQTKKLFNRFFLLGKMLALGVSIQNNNFDEDEYKNGVSIPYEKIKQIYDKCKANSSQPTNQDIAQAVNYLIQIMRTKGMTQEQITERIKRLESEVLISIM